MKEFDGIGGRLKKLKEWKEKELGEKLTNKRISQLTGLGDRHYQTLESGASFTISTLAKIQKAYQCNFDWLLTGKGQPYDVPLEPLPAYTGDASPFIHPQMRERERLEREGPDPVQGHLEEFFETVPLAEARLSAGGGEVVQSELAWERYAFRRAWLRRITSSPKDMILMVVKGDSMEQTIQDGDMVMIDQGRRDIVPGKIFAIGAGDTVMIKRLEMTPDGRVKVISDNKQYDPYIMDGKDLRVIGQVVWFARELVRYENGICQNCATM